MGLKTCLFKHSARMANVDRDELTSAANDYVERGMERQAAEEQAILDKLDELAALRKRVISEVVAEFERKMPERARNSRDHYEGGEKAMPVEPIISKPPAEVVPSAPKETLPTVSAKVEKSSKKSTEAIADKSTPELPSILTDTKAKHLKAMAAEKGIKKGSPGYEAAMSRLEDDYESELDRAHAELTFEKYNELNSDTPESLNRQAYDALRGEMGLDLPLYSLKDDTKEFENGLPEEQVKATFNKFIKLYKGAGDVKLRILGSTSEFPGYVEARDRGSRLDASYQTRSGILSINRRAFDNTDTLEAALREELLVHKGLGFFPPEGRREIYENIKRAIKEDKTGKLTKIWAETERNYKSQADQLELNGEERNNLFAEEFLGKVAQIKVSPLSAGFSQLYLAVKRALVKIGFIKNTVTLRELQNVVNSIGGYYKDGRQAPKRNWIADVKGSSSKADSRVNSDTLYSRSNTDSTQTRSGGFSVSGVLVKLTDKAAELASKERREASIYKDSMQPDMRTAIEQLGDGEQRWYHKVLQEVKRQFTSSGLLPQDVFAAKIKADSAKNADQTRIEYALQDFASAIEEVYKKKYSELGPQVKKDINEYLRGNTQGHGLTPIGVAQLSKLRDDIRNMSKAHVAQLLEDAADLELEVNSLESQNKKSEASSKRLELESKKRLIDTISENFDTYLNRSYRAFDDKDWPNKIRKNHPKVYENAVNYLAQQNANGQPVTQEHLKKAALKVDLILHEGTAFDSLGSFIAESKLGAKDLSSLKKKKTIAPEILALLGEYEDAAINYTKSMSKMSALVHNHAFLKSMKQSLTDSGLLFDEHERPLGANKKIAGEQTETYSPLNGMYTYPWLEQALRDALDRHKDSAWYSGALVVNGAIKMGKTVLSPTTAVRNFMSAGINIILGGHWNLKHLNKSVGLMHNYLSGGSKDSRAYIEKLVRIGVLYDTPNMREMQELIQAAKDADNWITRALDKSRVTAPLRFAQKFYSAGDDFWKVIGFENEKAFLMKHKGMGEEQAEQEAAKRIRNTYMTYSMVPKFTRTLRRTIVIGGFVAYPSEVIRNTYHRINYLQQDAKELGWANSAVATRAVGLIIAAAGMAALAAVSKALHHIDDDDEKAIRMLGSEFSSNSDILIMGRDKDGALTSLDLSWLDPYNLWKRPINAMFKHDRDFSESAKDAGIELLRPFFGLGVAAGALKGYYDDLITHKVSQDKALDRLVRGLQPGVITSGENVYMAFTNQYRRNGQKYDLGDELAAFTGFRMTTLNAKAALNGKAYEYLDEKRIAAKEFKELATDLNKVSDGDLRDSYQKTMDANKASYEKLQKTIAAAEKAGINKQQAKMVLAIANISQKDAANLVNGREFKYTPPKSMLLGAIKRAKILMNAEAVADLSARKAQLEIIMKKGGVHYSEEED